MTVPGERIAHDIREARNCRDSGTDLKEIFEVLPICKRNSERERSLGVSSHMFSSTGPLFYHSDLCWDRAGPIPANCSELPSSGLAAARVAPRRSGVRQLSWGTWSPDLLLPDGAYKWICLGPID